MAADDAASDQKPVGRRLSFNKRKEYAVKEEDGSHADAVDEKQAGQPEQLKDADSKVVEKEQNEPELNLHEAPDDSQVESPANDEIVAAASVDTNSPPQ